MSLPSIPAVAAEFGIDMALMRDADIERVLVESMRRDLPLAVAHLHRMAHLAIDTNAIQYGNEDPSSPLGKQLTRIFAGTVLRELAKKHFCHNQELAFLNCCGPIVGPEKPDIIKLMMQQIQMQDGTIAFADC
jgi:hypothetical protein